MPTYTNVLGSVPTQYFLLFKYLIPTLFSFFFLSVFHSIFFPPFLLPFFPFVLLTSPFFLLFFLFFLPIFPPIVFSPPFLFASFLLGMSDQTFECPTKHLNVQPLLNMKGHIVLALRKLIRALLNNSSFEWLKRSVSKQTHPLIISTH